MGIRVGVKGETEVLEGGGWLIILLSIDRLFKLPMSTYCPPTSSKGHVGKQETGLQWASPVEKGRGPLHMVEPR